MSIEINTTATAAAKMSAIVNAVNIKESLTPLETKAVLSGESLTVSDTSSDLDELLLRLMYQTDDSRRNSMLDYITAAFQEKIANDYAFGEWFDEYMSANMEMSEIDAKLDEMEERLELIGNDIESLEEEVEGYENLKKLNQVKINAGPMEGETDEEFAARVEDLKAANAGYDGRINELNAQISDLRAEAAGIREEGEALHARYNELDALVTTLIENVEEANLEDVVDELKSKLVALKSVFGSIIDIEAEKADSHKHDNELTIPELTRRLMDEISKTIDKVGDAINARREVMV